MLSAPVSAPTAPALELLEDVIGTAIVPEMIPYTHWIKFGSKRFVINFKGESTIKSINYKDIITVSRTKVIKTQIRTIVITTKRDTFYIQITRDTKCSEGKKYIDDVSIDNVHRILIFSMLA